MAEPGARTFRPASTTTTTIVSLFVDSRSFAPLKVAFSKLGSVRAGVRGAERHGPIPAPEGRELLRAKARSARWKFRSAASRGGPACSILLRGLVGPYLAGRDPPPCRSSPAFYRRLAHRPAQWERRRSRDVAAPDSVRVPAALCSVTDPDTDAQAPDGREGRFDIERACPHRVLRWEWRAAAKWPAARWHRPRRADRQHAPRVLADVHDPGDERYLTRGSDTRDRRAAPALARSRSGLLPE